MNDHPLDPNSFNAAYEVLKNNAVLLSRQEEPDIDRLLPLVEESIKAYNICKTRLEAVQQALEQQIGAETSDHDPADSQGRP
ncbi:MAG: exodeoxyribonuclease VII small subunit [Candidatus Competibacteraceae bacterium]|jgi:exodeoxyribonuclease VII small subunit